MRAGLPDPMSLAYDRIVYPRSNQVEAYDRVACRTCSGPMETCLTCQGAGEFPLHCAGPCRHAHATTPGQTPMPKALPPRVRPRDLSKSGRTRRLKRLAHRCGICGWDNPRGATVYRWGRCYDHYIQTVQTQLRLLQRVVDKAHGGG